MRTSGACLQCFTGRGRGAQGMRLHTAPLLRLGLVALTTVCRTYLFAMPAEGVAVLSVFMVQYGRNTTFYL